MSDPTVTPTPTDTRQECPGEFVRWSAFGASYPDTVCAYSLIWPEGEHPGAVLCDADNDLRPGDVPCPAHDPEGFAEWADDPTAARRVLAREAAVSAPDLGVLSEQRLQFARECADPDWSLSVPEPAKAVIRDLLGERERLLAALAAAHAEVERLRRVAHDTDQERGIFEYQRDEARAALAALRKRVTDVLAGPEIASVKFSRLAALAAAPSETEEGLLCDACNKVRPADQVRSDDGRTLVCSVCSPLARCPECGSPDQFEVRPPCSLDQYDPDPWHRTRPVSADPKGTR